ncbi:MAG: SDR family oxidoreductase [Oscillospiraceae bacterium]|nr:SDR family oxidoreductase [Oscillospiraceae bacterium]
MKKRKTALVTGASGGLGLEFARLLAKKHYDLVLVARNEDKLNGIKSELEKEYGVTAWVCPCDLSRADAALDVYQFTQAHDLEIDVLINNAGFGDSGKFAESNWQKQYEMVQVDITALMQLTHCFLPGMVERGHGKILNLSSVAAFCAGPGMSVYYASKAFVRSFSEAVAEEVKGTGVTVTALCPGPTATGFEAAADMGKGSKMFKKAAKPEDVAKAGIRALRLGKVLCYQGSFTKWMGFLCRLVPRSVTRRYAAKMDK